jgi:hypothetical protein
MYINGLHDALRDRGLGVLVYGRLVPLLLYADDIVLFAESPDMLATMLEVVSAFARDWRFDVNHGKSNLMVVGRREVQAAVRSARWTLAGGPLLVVDSYKYLGIDVTHRRTRGKWNTTINRLVAKARTALGLVMYQGGGANGLRPRTMVHQWKSIVRPLLEYGCEIWEGEIPDALSAKIEAVQSRFCRASLGCKYMPASAAVRADMGLCTLKAKRQRHKLSYWAKLCEANNDRLLSIVFRNRHIEVCAGGGHLSSTPSVDADRHGL